MESSIKISLNSNIHEKNIILPANLEQLKSVYKKIYNLNDQQIPNLKIYYMKEEKEQKIKINLVNDSDYMNFYLGEHPDLIEAELDNLIIEANSSPNMIKPDSHIIETNSNCLRCLEKECFLVPFIILHKDQNNNILINYHCRNNHKGENISINDYKSFFNKKLEDILCSFCSLNKEKDKNIRLYYCNKCKKYICNLEKCNNTHEKNCNNNDFMQLEKMDSNCILHGKNLMYYCEECKVSFCNLCKEHINHKKLIIDEMFIKLCDKNKMIEIIDKNLNELKKVFNLIEEKIHKLYNIYEMNKNLLELNKKFIENLNEKEVNGEIYINFNNCKYIKEIISKDNLEYFISTFKQIEEYFSNEFFEFNEEKQKNKILFWNKIPLEISLTKNAKKAYKIKKLDKTKYLLPLDFTMGQFSYFLKKKLNIDQNDNLFFLLVNGKVSCPYEMNLKDIYDKYKKEDNILYLTIEKALLWG